MCCCWEVAQQVSALGMGLKTNPPRSLIRLLRSRATWQLLKVPVLLVLGLWKPVTDGLSMLNANQGAAA